MSSSDTSGEPAGLLPPEENYDVKTALAAASSPPHYEEKTVVIYGQENIINWVLRTLPTVTKTIDQCGDRNGPSILLLNEQIWQKHIEMHNRGVRQRIVVDHQGKYHTLQKADAISRAEASGWAYWLSLQKFAQTGGLECTNFNSKS